MAKSTKPLTTTLVHVLIGIGVISLDQVTKSIALQSIPDVLMNAGIIGGIFQNHHPLVKTLFIANFGLIISLIYLYIVFFVLQKRKMLAVIVTFLYAALMSNLIDRIRLGAIIDFIRIGTDTTAMYFNVADFIQQAAVVGIALYSYWHRRELVRTDEKRGQYLLDPKSQLSGAAFFAAITFMVGIGISSINYVYFNTLGILNEYKSSDHILLALMASLFCSLTVFVFTILYTFRYVGPVMALKKFLENENSSQFSLRETDLFQFIVEPVNKRIKKDL